MKAGEALLAFGPAAVAGAGEAVAVLNLSPSGDLREAAANLFSMIQSLDGSGAATIAVAPIPRSWARRSHQRSAAPRRRTA